MNPLLKQRLVGTIVLLALGVVFWPLIFDSPDLHDPIALRPMSEKPVIDRTPISPPESFEATVKQSLPEVMPIDSEVQQAADDSTRTDVTAAELDTLSSAEEMAGTTDMQEELVDEQGLPLFWVLQVATVGSAERADELVAGLQGRGYRAFSKRFMRVDDVLYRVQIGPNVDQARLQQMKPEIDGILSVDSQVLRYVQ